MLDLYKLLIDKALISELVITDKVVSAINNASKNNSVLIVLHAFPDILSYDPSVYENSNSIQQDKDNIYLH